ncbi:MAG: hypothetical protein HY744_34665 [Deltaproteobacteria bacterium]|nr:hypothetical protein [Deltaproteobacteria bacterium]
MLARIPSVEQAARVLGIDAATLRRKRRKCRARPRDRRHLSVDRHEHTMRPVDDWGRQVGARLWAERPGAR